jgi:hypothetical protein
VQWNWSEAGGLQRPGTGTALQRGRSHGAMNSDTAQPADEPAFAGWLDRVILDGHPGQEAEPSVQPMECVPADYVRRAIIAHLEGKRLIRSGIQTTSTCFTGDLHLENLEIDFPLFFIRCVFEGAIYGGGAKTKTLSFTGSTLRQGADLRNVRIDGHLFLRGPFEAAGPLILRDMKIEGTLDLRGGRFLYGAEVPTGPFVAAANSDCLGLSRAEATALLWGRHPPRGTGAHRAEVAELGPQGLITLRDLKVRSFRHDLKESDGLKTWPERGKLVLDGFTYERIDDAPLEGLLQWLRLQDKDQADPLERKEARAERGRTGVIPLPAPYFQLASVLEKQGRKDDATRIRAQVRRNDVESYGQPRRFLAQAFFWPVDYGVSPSRALGLMLGLLVAFLASIAWLNASGQMAPAADGLLRDPCYYGVATCGEDLGPWQHVRLATSPPVTRHLPPDYPALSPLEYGLEAFVPVFDFGQHQHWEPASPAVRLILAVVALFGIFLGSLFAATVGGLLLPRNA